MAFRILFLASFLTLAACSQPQGQTEQASSLESDDLGWLSKSALNSVIADDGSIQLTFKSANPTLVHYIFRSDDLTNFTLVGKAYGRPTFKDFNIQPRTKYYYRVFSHPTLEPDLGEFDSNHSATLPEVAATCFSPTVIRQLKSATDVDDARAKFTQMYLDCAPMIDAKVDRPLSDHDRMAVFAMHASHAMAMYGGSKKSKLMDLLNERDLDCDNYGFLAGHLFELLAGGNYTEEWSLVGFDGGYIRNHAQIAYHSVTNDMLLDPTTGIVAFVPFRDLVSGVVTPAQNIHSFYLYYENPGQEPSLLPYIWTVRRALINGYYRARDLTYFMPRAHGSF